MGAGVDLRTRLAAGGLAPWISPAVRAVHFRLDARQAPPAAAGAGASKGQKWRRPDPRPDLQAQITSMADFGILVRAACIVASQSGFSQQAALLGAQACHVDLDACLGLADGGSGGKAREGD